MGDVDDAFAPSQQRWRVTFNFKPTGGDLDAPGTVAVMNALQERGWRPSLSEPNEDGWYVVTCHEVEAERGDLAEGLVFHACIDAMPSPPRVDDFDRTQVPEFNGEPCGGTWTGTGEAADFTVSSDG